MFGCSELGFESGIVEFGPEFRRLEGPGNLAQNLNRFPGGAPAWNRYAHLVLNPLAFEFIWKSRIPSSFVHLLALLWLVHDTSAVAARTGSFFFLYA
jgi:hypothetical protein